MSVLCPYCSLNIELKGARPGRFTPKCPRCREKFVLLIPPEGVDHARAISLADASETAAAAPAITLSEDQGPAPGATVPPAAAPSQSAVTQPPVASPPPPSPSQSSTSDYFKAKKGRYADWEDDEPSTPSASVASAPVASVVSPAASPAVAMKPELASDASASAVAAAIAEEPAPLPEKAPFTGPTLSGTLGGYEIRHKLGHGGMGAVYLARQLSLDRNVALKVLLPQWSTDPQFVARFTREAFAAAQLTHHNVVQIHDIGAEQETHYFSMEYVEGRSLADLIKQEGRQDPEVAAGYMLQAARGLKFAHDHGMIHRDIKPDNLLINRQGIVKVADLGLVKTPATEKTEVAEGEASRTATPAGGAGRSRSASRARSLAVSHVTEASAVFGTPAFMAPEQCEDATKVDQRADIYSLGCTFYFLLTGRPPFSGQTAMEVMTKQIHEPVVPPEALSRHVPPEVSGIVMRMMAKRPEDRYQDLSELIEDLEAYLGIASAGPFTPREEHVRTIEAAVDQFYGSSTPRLRSHLIAGFFTVCTLGVIFAALAGSLQWASGFVGFGLMTSMAYFVISGLADKTYLFQKVRQMAFAAPLKEWVKAVLGVALIAVAIIVLGWGWIWLGFAVASVLLALVFSATIDSNVRKQREMPLRRVEEMLRTMRLRGLEETAIRQFVCKYAGERWEEFFEALFGYEAKMQARRLWGDNARGRRRRRFRAWRDPIIRWVDEHEAEQKRERDRHHLQSVEVRNLEAQGVDMLEARRRARQRAERMLEQAEILRESAMRQAATLAPGAPSTPVAAPPSARLVQAMVSGDETPAEGRHFKREHHLYITRRYGSPLDILFGSGVRFAAAVLILAGFLVWRYQNDDLPRLLSAAEEVATAQRQDDAVVATGRVTSAVNVVRDKISQAGVQRRLQLPGMPDFMEMLLGSWGAGVAGLLLMLSIFFRGKVFGLTVMGAAAIAILGPYFTVGDLDPQIQQQLAGVIDQAGSMLQQSNVTAQTLSMACAAGLFVVAVVFLRDRETA